MGKIRCWIRGFHLYGYSESLAFWHCHSCGKQIDSLAQMSYIERRFKMR